MRSDDLQLDLMPNPSKPVRLILAGGGGLGVEVEAYAYDWARARKEELVIAGIWATDTPRLDDLLTPAEQLLHISRLDDYRAAEGDQFIIAIGDPLVRLRVAKELDAIGARFATIVHPTAYVAAKAKLEPGVIIGPFAFVGPHARIGSHAVLNTYASVGHDASVGRACVLSPYAVINGAASLGEACFMGTGASVSPRVAVGPFSKVSAGSVTVEDAAPGSLIHGNPGRARVMFRPTGD